jgi:hypothetical protein
MIECKVLRLGYIPAEVAQRFRERAEQALAEGDFATVQHFMQFVPNDVAVAVAVAVDVLRTPRPSDFGNPG